MDNESGHGQESEHLDYWSFSLLGKQRLEEEVPGVDPNVNNLVLFLNRASGQLTSTLEAEAHKPLGLTWSGYRLLFVLWIAGDLEPHRAAALTNSSRASVSNLSNSFIEEGLLDRTPSQTDRRSVVLSLTDKGREKVKAAFLAQDKSQREWLSILTDTEQEILQMLLAKMMRPWTKATPESRE